MKMIWIVLGQAHKHADTSPEMSQPDAYATRPEQRHGQAPRQARGTKAQPNRRERRSAQKSMTQGPGMRFQTCFSVQD